MIFTSSISIDVTDINTGHVMEYTEACSITKELLISVPQNYIARLYVDGHYVTYIKTCQKRKVYKVLGKDNLDRSLRVLYINRRPLTEMSWGIGNIEYSYEDYGFDPVKLGAGGTFLAKITDYEKFMTVFGNRTEPIGVAEATSKIVSEFRKYARVILVELFKELRIPITVTDFIVDEVDKRLNDSICERELKELPGIEFKEIHVNNVCVCEEDVNKMKEKIETELEESEKIFEEKTNERRIAREQQKRRESSRKRMYLKQIKETFAKYGLIPESKEHTRAKSRSN